MVFLVFFKLLWLVFVHFRSFFVVLCQFESLFDSFRVDLTRFGLFCLVGTRCGFF